MSVGTFNPEPPDILTAIRLEADVSNKLATALADIEALLLEMIDPDGRKHSGEEMMSQRDWLQADLDFVVQTVRWSELQSVDSISAVHG